MPEPVIVDKADSSGSQQTVGIFQALSVAKRAAYATGTKLFEILGGAAGTTELFSVDSAGAVATAGALASSGALSGTRITGTSTKLTTGGTVDGAVASVERISKVVTAISDNTATEVLTVTVPNAAHSAAVRVTLMGTLGAGGAVGAREATGVVSYDIAVSRTAGVAVVAVASSAYGSGMSNVAGAATITVTAAVGNVVGEVTETNTFPVNVTINSGSGSSANHTCVVVAEVINAVASGVTVA